MTTIHDFTADRIDGHAQPLAEYRGRVLLIVNTASRCGFTPQYQGLQKLYETYRDAGLEILGFPCNQFAGQEPGESREILQFCQMNYGITFPLFAKIDVNGEHAHPLYEFLKSEAKGALGLRAIKWNFTKFLVDREGRVLRRYAPNTAPAKLEADIAVAL